MDRNHFLNNAISHKDLSAFLIKAKKDISSGSPFVKNKPTEEQEFDDLVRNWTDTSEKILQLMTKKDKVFFDNKDPKTLMALGAMGAHINMALQAVKSIGSDQ